MTTEAVDALMVLAHHYADAKMMRYGMLGIENPPDPDDAAQALRAAIQAAHAADRAKSDTVPMPATEDQAAGMVLVGTRWLQDHAPHRLTDQAKSATLAADVIGCFEAAMCEELQAVLAESSDEKLKDLVERRLMHALYYAQEAMSAEPMLNGLTREESEATASCMGLVGAKSEPADISQQDLTVGSGSGATQVHVHTECLEHSRFTGKSEPAAPEGFELVAVKGFSELMYWLERCDSKGHLDNCSDLLEPWANFDYRTFRATTTGDKL